MGPRGVKSGVGAGAGGLPPVAWPRLLALGAILLTFVFVLMRANQRASLDSHAASAGGERQYGIVLDAGSSGSRVHVYSFGQGAQVLHEVFEQTKPGLSSYAASPEAAAASLEPLINVAREAIPQRYWSCTPMTLKATAGLRMLGDQTAQAVLDAVTEYLAGTPFHLGSVEIMPGELEGVHAWTAVNLLLERLGGGKKAATYTSESSMPTVGIIDLGGGSAQVLSFPPPPPPFFIVFPSCSSCCLFYVAFYVEFSYAT